MESDTQQHDHNFYPFVLGFKMLEMGITNGLLNNVMKFAHV